MTTGKENVGIDAGQTQPRVTIGVVSYNRLHYLRATLESAKDCIVYPNLEWIVVDGNSSEPGLRTYLESCTWIDQCRFMDCSHPQAMNTIIEQATGEFVLIWPEDVQFIVRGDWMKDLVEIMTRNPWIGSVCMDPMRRSTIRSVFSPSVWSNRDRLIDEIARYGLNFRRQRVLRSSRGFGLRTFGWVKQGVCGSGIPSLTRTSVWRELGPWMTRRPSSVRLIDSSLGAEEEMVQRFYKSRLPLQGAITLVPVAADIITDPTGCKAKIRGRYRYGVYMPPQEGPFYYRIRNLDEMPATRDNMPLSFVESVEPLGFKLPLDSDGDRLKSSINTSVVYDRTLQQEIPYPLTMGVDR